MENCVVKQRQKMKLTGTQQLIGTQQSWSLMSKNDKSVGERKADKQDVPL